MDLTPTPPPLNLDEIRLRIEAEANKTAATHRRHGALLVIFARAVLDAALAGNVTCRNALAKALPLLNK